MNLPKPVVNLKKMKTVKYFIVLLIILGPATSCKKNFLDVPTKNTMTLQEHVKDLKTLSEFLNGNYFLLSKDFYFLANQMYPDLVSDNIKPVSAGSSYFKEAYMWALNPEGGGLTNLNAYWTLGYQIIRASSFIINKADEYRSQDPIKADDLKGQAYALRALIHFTLVNEFAQAHNFTADGSHPGIPYITEFDWNEPVNGRQTVAEVYENLVSDLNNAIQVLPANAISTLFMNQLAAKALLGRVYLFKGDFEQAKNLAVEVCKVKPIMQTNYPAKLFTLEETEALFQVPPSAKIPMQGPSGEYTGTYITQYQGMTFRSPILFFVATTDIADLLEQNPDDLRSAWIGRGSKDTITKYPGNVVPGFGTKFGSYYPTVLRSSEMSLTAAEAYAKIGNNDSARFYVNEIRTRANIPAFDASVTGTALFDSICVERRKELAFEGLRMFDLLRWKKGVFRSDAWSASAQTLPYPSNKAIAPLPPREITITGLQQNPGY